MNAHVTEHQQKKMSSSFGFGEAPYIYDLPIFCTLYILRLNTFRLTLAMHPHDFSSHSRSHSHTIGVNMCAQRHTEKSVKRDTEQKKRARATNHELNAAQKSYATDPLIWK